MSRHRRQRAQQREEAELDDDEDEREPPPRSGNALLFGGAALVTAGFVAGFLVGQDNARSAAPAPMMNAPFLQAQAQQQQSAPMQPSGSLAPAVLPPPHKGHTFTGNIDVPPHSEEAHQLADVLLRDVTCPCGGCDHMKLGTCTCDTAKEVAGFAAHLLERGKRGDEVLTALAPRYGLDVADHLAEARGITLANPQLADAAPAAPASMEDAPPASSSSSTLDGLSGLSEMASKPGVQRLIDVPTSARPKPKP